MKAHFSLVGALSALALLSVNTGAVASSHREAPAISNDPAADNTDLWAWVQGGNLEIIASYIPLEEPAGGPNFHSFSDEVLYEIYIARGPADLDEDLVYQFRFTTSHPGACDPATLPASGTAGALGCEFFSQISGITQTYSVTKIENGTSTVLANNVKVAPPNIGPRTNAIAYGIPAGKTYEQFFVDDAATTVVTSLGAGQGKVFAGPRDDGFYVDLGAVFDLAGLQTVLGGTPKDNVAGYNAHSIALEIPLTVANGGTPVVSGAANDNQTIGVWATASRRKMTVLRPDGKTSSYGPWVQVSRQGLPLINEAVIGLQDKDRYNRTHPKDDLANFGSYILNPVLVRNAEFAGFYAAGGPLAGCPGGAAQLKTNRLDIANIITLNGPLGHNIAAIGDVQRVDLGTVSGFPNGRPIHPGTNTEDDVTDISLSLILCGLAAPVPDGANYNDATYKNAFPYLATPWEGASQGHGVPNP